MSGEPFGEQHQVCSASTLDCPERRTSLMRYAGDLDDDDFEQLGCGVKQAVCRVNTKFEKKTPFCLQAVNLPSRGNPPLDWSCRFASSSCRQECANSFIAVKVAASRECQSCGNVQVWSSFLLPNVQCDVTFLMLRILHRERQGHMCD